MFLTEKHPKLKSKENFKNLVNKLESTKIEEDISNSRKYYNEVVLGKYIMTKYKGGILNWIKYTIN